MLNALRLLLLICFAFLLISGCSHNDIRYQSDLTASGLKTIIWETDNQDKVTSAELRLAIKTGSLAEQDNERGFAHFVEHLAFNNTAKYPKESLFRVLESFGLSFGAHSNAHTGFDQTVYKLTVKNVTEAKLDKAMEILAQWAMHVQFDQKTVDAEKGVIREEWRLRQPQEKGWQARYIKALYQNSRYADRLPIGDIKVIETATAQNLTAFYKRWYQPNNAAIIVTGNVNKDQVNKLITKHFSSWQKHNDINENTYNISTQQLPAYLPLADKKVDTNTLQFDYFLPVSRPDNADAVYERQAWIAALTILDQRFEARVQETAGNVNGIYTNWSYPSPDVLNITFGATLPGDGTETAARLLNEETAYLLQHGVTDTELAAWKQRTLERNRAFKETAKGQADQALQHFLYNKPLQEQSEWLNTLEQRLPTLAVATVNTVIRKLLADPAHTLFIHNPTFKAPIQTQLAQWLNESKATGAARQARVATAGESGDWLIQPENTGRITATRSVGNLQEWTLNNGIKVYYRHSKHQPGKVWYQLAGMGGMNQLNPQETIHSRLALETIGASGLREMNGPQLEKWFNNQNLTLRPYYGFFDRGLYGDGSNKNFAKLMRLLHVSLTEGRVAPQAWQHNLESNRQQLTQLAKSRVKPWRTQTDRVLFSNDTAFRLLTLDELDAVKPEQLKRIYDRYFAGAQNYRLAIVGDLSEADAKAAVLESVATLPATAASTTPAPRAYPRITQSADIEVKGSGERSAVLIHKLTLPRSNIDLDYTQLAYLRSWLDAVLLEELREKDGLVYSVNSQLESVFSAVADYTITIQLACDPDKVAEVKQRIGQILQQMIDNPPPQERLQAWQTTRSNAIADGLQKPGRLASMILVTPQTDIPLEKMDDVAYRTRLPEAAKLANALEQLNGGAAKKTWLTWLP